MNKVFCSMIMMFYISFVEGNIIDHLKPAPEKSGMHQMRNIDFIYMINLDQRPEKFEKSTNQLHPYGIYPYRFSAVNGWEITLDQISDIGVKYAPGMDGGFMATYFDYDGDLVSKHESIKEYGRTYFCHCMGRGTIGIILSHLSVLKDAYDSGYDTIWIMEDDIHVIQDPRIIPDLIDQLNAIVGYDGWDILYTDVDIRDAKGKHVPAHGMARRPNYKPKNERRLHIKKQVSPAIRQVGAKFGATSMIVRRSGMEKILKFYETYNAFSPYDMENLVAEDMRAYSVLSDVVTNLSDALSDNGAPNYLKK